MQWVEDRCPAIPCPRTCPLRSRRAHGAIAFERNEKKRVHDSPVCGSNRARGAALCRALCCGSAWGLHKACPAAHARRRRFCVQAPVARRPEQHADGHGERLQLFAGTWAVTAGARFLTAKNFLRVGFPGYPELQSFSERASSAQFIRKISAI